MKLMMKFFLVTALLTSSAFAYVPKFEVIHDEDNTVTLVTENDTGRTLECGYVISWFENTLTYKRYFGSFGVNAGQMDLKSFKSDAYAKLTRIKARVECND